MGCVFSVMPREASLRLDLYLHELFPHISRRILADLFLGRHIRVNDRPARKGDRVLGREEITLEALAYDAVLCRTLEKAAKIPLVFCYRDDAIFAVDKPCGLSTLPLSLSDRDTLGNAVLAHFPDLAHVGHTPFDCGLVQRLDRDTSGIVLGARTQEVWESLWREMQAGSVEKTYFARVSGIPTDEEGLILHRLFSRSHHSERVLVDFMSETDTPTYWKVVSHDRDSALLEVRIHRGFRHQIRAHLAAMGHPILGDRLYLGKPADRLYLHASELELTHPVSGERIQLTSACPKEFRMV